MRILACHNRYAVRGGEDIAFDTAVTLWRAGGHEVHTFERDNAALARSGTAARWEAGRRAVRNPAVAAALADEVRRVRPDVAVVQNTLPQLSLAPYQVLQDAAVPVIQVLYNYRYLCLNGELYTRGAICERCAAGNYWHGVVRRCYRGSLPQSLMAARPARANRRHGVWRLGVRLFVSPDRFLGEKLSSYGLPAERFRIIPNAVERRAPPSQLAHDGGMLYVGRWSRAKGVMTLLEAARDGRIPVTLVGDGPDREQVTAHPAVRSGVVTLTPPQYGEALWERLSRAAAVVVPSQWYDNLPMIVCQAFVASRPVIASRINGIPEYVHDGENGLLVEPGDVTALRGAMEAIGRDQARWLTLARGARTTAEREFGFDHWLARWNRVFQEVAS